MDGVDQLFNGSPYHTYRTFSLTRHRPLSLTASSTQPASRLPVLLIPDPPSAAASGKRIRARLKPGVRRLEIHVPVDTRPEVWNTERSRELGFARDADDREKNQQTVAKGKQREGEESRLSEIRMRSEQIPQTSAYVLGVVRDGKRA